MSKEKIKTLPDLLKISPAHLEASKDLNNHFKSWAFNVKDEFKNLSVEEIKQKLQETAHPFAVCFENVIGDFNLGTGIRNANAFNAREVFYLGNKKWDRRSAVGVHNYSDVKWIPTIDEFFSLKEKYVFVGIDNVPGSINITNYDWALNSMMIFGEEGVGLTPEVQKHCSAIVAIEMFGSVRSLNCGTASGIAMYDYVNKFKWLQENE